MSSGFGIRGGIGRCYPFYAELKECLVVSDLTTRNITTESGRALSKLASSNGTGKKSSESDNGVACRPMREDYFECLHHNKEYQMVSKVMAQQKKNEELEKMGEAVGQVH